MLEKASKGQNGWEGLMERRSLVEVVVISHDGLLVVEVVEVVEIDRLAELGYKGLNN
jgi:hypothetical protein